MAVFTSMLFGGTKLRIPRASWIPILETQLSSWFVATAPINQSAINYSEAAPF